MGPLLQQSKQTTTNQNSISTKPQPSQEPSHIQYTIQPATWNFQPKQHQLALQQQTDDNDTNTNMDPTSNEIN
ncbi:28535_t:CDS:1, partial [Gigaspora margarita]